MVTSSPILSTARWVLAALGLIVFFCFQASITFADVAKGPKRSAAEWGAAWEALKLDNLAGENDLAYISRIAVAKKTKSGFEVLPLDQKDADEHSFMTIPAEKDLNLSRFVNKQISAKQPKAPQLNSCEVSLQSIATCWALDAILDISAQNWRLLKFNKVKGSFDTLLEAPGEADENYFQWIHKQLNYDGVLVDVENDYLLVLLPPGRKGSDIQALTLQDSAGRIVLPTSTAKGTSLLQLIQRSGRFAVFLPVISSADAAKSFVKGSKLIIEKGK